MNLNAPWEDEGGMMHTALPERHNSRRVWNLTACMGYRYNSYTWGGEKGIVLTTNTWIGGKNPFIGIYMLVLGTLFLVACLTMLATYISRPRHKRSANLDFSWQRDT